MRPLKIVLVSLATVTVVIGGVLWHISNQDLSNYDFVEQSLEDYTGRDLTMGGELRIRIWLTSTATMTEVTLANAQWGSAPAMLKVGTLEAAFNPFALLWDEVRIKRFILEDTEILLETDSDGRGNWIFTEGADLEPAQAPETDQPFPFKIHVDGVQWTNAKGAYRDGTTGKTHEFELEEFTATADAMDDSLNLSLAATYQGQSVALEGRAGPLAQFFSDRTMEVDLTAEALGMTATAEGTLGGIAGGDVQALDVSVVANSSAQIAEALELDIPELSGIKASGTISTREGKYSLQSLEAEVGAGAGKATAKGSVADLIAAAGIDLAIAITAPKVSEFSGIAGTELPDAGPVAVSARLTSTDQGYSVPDFSAEIADSKVVGQASIDVSTTPKRVQAQIEAATLNLDHILPKGSAGTAPATDAAAPKSASGKLFPSEPLPLDRLDDLDVEVSIRAQRLIVDNIEINDLSLPVIVKESKLSVAPAARLAEGSLDGELQVDGAVMPPEAALQLNLNDFLLGRLMAMVARSDLVSGGRGDFKLDVTSSGESVAALMARSNGMLRLNTGRGEIANSLLDTVGADMVTGMLSFLVPSSEKTGVTQMECTRVSNDIDDGMVTVHELVLVSSKAVLQGTGAVNLRDESYDMGVSVKARKGISLSAGDLAGGVRITGPLGAPNVNLNPEGVAATAAFGTAAVMTGGLSFLAEKALELAKSDNPCATATGGTPGRTATEQSSSSAPTADAGEQAPGEQPRNEPAEMMESFGESIKGIFKRN